MPYEKSDGAGGGGPANFDYLKKYAPAEEEMIQQLLAQMMVSGSMGPNVSPVTNPNLPGKGRAGGTSFRREPPVTMSKRAAPKQSVEKQQMDDLDALFNNLMGMVGAGGGASVDYESALRDSEAAIREAYAHDIAAIRSGNAAARKDTAKARRAIESAYRGLAKTYTRTGKRSVKQDKKLANAMQKNSQQSANFIDKQADDRLNEQAALAQGLGIEAAMPAAAEGVTKETNNTVNRIIKEGASDANRQLGFSGNNQRYMERGGQLARLEGTNRSTDLLADLQDFLQGNRQQIAGLKGDRSRELAANESSIMGSVAEMQQAAEADTWDRLMQLAGLKMDIEREQFDQSSNMADYRLKLLGMNGGSGESPDMFPGAENFANAQNYLNQLSRPKIGTNIFDDLLNDKSITTGNYYDDEAKREFKMTPYKAMQMIEQAAQENNLSQQDINLLRLAIFAQLGG